MTAVGSGCSAVSLTPSLDEELHAGLAHMIESAQDDLWWYRDSLATDPEGTLPQIDSVSDARPSYEDPAFVPHGGVYTLVDVSSSPEGSTLTLATSAGAESGGGWRSEEHTSELQSLMRISYAVFCLKK